MTSRKCLHISSIGRQVLVADATVGQGLPGGWNTPDGLKPTMLDYRAGADNSAPTDKTGQEQDEGIHRSWPCTRQWSLQARKAGGALRRGFFDAEVFAFLW